MPKELIQNEWAFEISKPALMTHFLQQATPSNSHRTIPTEESNIQMYGPMGTIPIQTTIGCQRRVIEDSG